MLPLEKEKRKRINNHVIEEIRESEGKCRRENKKRNKKRKMERGKGNIETECDLAKGGERVEVGSDEVLEMRRTNHVWGLTEWVARAFLFFCCERSKQKLNLSS